MLFNLSLGTIAPCPFARSLIAVVGGAVLSTATSPSRRAANGGHVRPARSASQSLNLGPSDHETVAGQRLTSDPLSAEMANLQTFATQLKAAVITSLATPKRDPTKPAGVESWFKYYAGFSPAFARAVLSHASLHTAATVLDPWNGSGTTTYTAASLGLRSLGIDISPIANVVASAKIAHRADLAHSHGLVKQVLTNARAIRPSSTEVDAHPLRQWLHSDDVAGFLALYRTVLELLARPSQADRIDPLTATPPPLSAFFILCLLRAVRAHAGTRPSTNPTWVRPPKRRTRLRGETGYVDIRNTFQETVRTLAVPFADAPPLSGDPANVP